MVKRIAHSARLSQAIQEHLWEGTDRGAAHPLDSFIRLGARYLLQVGLEQEVAEFLGRAHYQRGARERLGYRNGYKARHFNSVQGKLQVAIPQVRGTTEEFPARLLKQLKGGSVALQRLVTEMYVRGLSCADVEKSFQQILGRRIISKSGVSRLTEHLVTEFDQWRRRDLSQLDIIYLFLDGIYLALRQGTAEKEGVLCAYGITSTGKKVLLHLDVGERESYPAWLSFLQELVSRGLQVPLLVIHDGNPGLKRSIREVFPQARRQRCQVHKMRNILAKLPRQAQAEVKSLIWDVFRAASYEEGLAKGQSLLTQLKPRYPSAMDCLEKDLPECLTYLQFPKLHARAIRTTNLLERTFEEQRRRDKVIGRFQTEQSGLKLMYAVLCRVAQSWHGLKMPPEVIQQLKQLCQEIRGAPPTNLVNLTNTNVVMAEKGLVEVNA